jgi:hypothetical protein
MIYDRKYVGVYFIANKKEMNVPAFGLLQTYFQNISTFRRKERPLSKQHTWPLMLPYKVIGRMYRLTIILEAIYALRWDNYGEIQ